MEQYRISRLGPSRQRPRPVKVFLNDENVVKQCIRNETNIRITLDLTPFQREQQKCSNRTQKSGKKDLT